MPKGKGYGTFEDTFGSQDNQLNDSSSSENTLDMWKKAQSDAAYLRSTNLGNADHGGRPFIQNHK